MDLDNRFKSATNLPLEEIPFAFSFATRRYIVKAHRAVKLKILPDGSSGKYMVSSHDHLFYELNYSLAGTSVLTADGKVYDTPAGTMWVVAPRVTHAMVAHKGSASEGYRLVIEIQRNENEEVNEALWGADFDDALDILTSNRCFFGKDTYGAGNAVKSIFEQLQLENGRLNPSKYKLDILQILLLTAKSMGKLTSVEICKTDVQTENNRLLYLDEIFKGYHTEISQEAVAQKLNISVRQLNRIIQRHYGLTFKQQYLSSRMSLATTLLESAELLSVAEISEKLNFSSCKRFSKSFKEFYGVSPTQYRASYKNGQISQK